MTKPRLLGQRYGLVNSAFDRQRRSAKERGIKFTTGGNMSEDKVTIEVGCLAMRVEGEFWNAYWAKPTMEGAVLLASIRMKLVQDQDGKNAFVELMKIYVANMVEEVTGHRPTHYDITNAAESERSGNA